MSAGVVYLTEDRKSKGLLLEENIAVNLTLASLDKFQRGPLIDRAREARALDEAIQRFDIRVGDRTLLAGQMSGGNQQKLLLAKMMQLDPQVVVIDEPTRGIDIGAKQQIYRFIAALAAEGRSVIVISSEMAELIGICHRIVVMRNGRVVGEVAGEAMNEHEIVVLATGVETTGRTLGHDPGGARGSGRRAAARASSVSAVAPFLALALICALGALANPRFLSFDNLTNVLARSAFIATIAVGQTLVITGGGLDLSVGAMAAFVSGLTILFLNSGLIDNMPLLIVSAMVLALAVGALVRPVQRPDHDARQDRAVHRDARHDGHLPLAAHLAGAGRRRSPSGTPMCGRPIGQVYFGDLFGVPYPVLVILGVAVAGAFISLPHRLRAACARGRLERGRRALLRHQRRPRAHHHLRAPGPLRRARGHRLRAASRFGQRRRPGLAGS